MTRDLELFDAGDATEVGEKGLTLRQVDTFCRNDTLLMLLTMQWRPKGRVIVFLSGQIAHSKMQARVTLARAVYSSAKIILLDDVSQNQRRIATLTDPKIRFSLRWMSILASG